jgi:hypothetical protein
MATGIFFHYQEGERLRDFPQALGKILSKNNVFFYDAFYPSKPKSFFELEPIRTESLLKVHTPPLRGPSLRQPRYALVNSRMPLYLRVMGITMQAVIFSAEDATLMVLR